MFRNKIGVNAGSIMRRIGLSVLKTQKATVMARFSASLAYVFAARMTVGQYGPALAPRHRLSLQYYNQEDEEARRERGSNEPDRHHRGRIVGEAARAEPAPVRIFQCLRQRSDARSWRRTLHGTGLFLPGRCAT